MYKKYGTEWASREEYKQWLCDEIRIIIHNVEYIYNIYKNDKRKTRAIYHACLYGGYGYTQLTQQDKKYILENL